MVNDNQLNLLRRMAQHARVADMDVALGANVLEALVDGLTKARDAEGTVRGMVDALTSVFPPGFRGDNPVWACGKLADEFQDRSSELAAAQARAERLTKALDGTTRMMESYYKPSARVYAWMGDIITANRAALGEE